MITVIGVTLFRVLRSGKVAGPLLLASISCVGALYIVSTIADEENLRIRSELAFHFGRDVAHQDPALDGVMQRFRYWTEGTLDDYLSGFHAGQLEIAQRAIGITPPANAPDTGLIRDVTHALPEGRSWRNIGIVHRRESYDPRASPHFLSAARESDAVLTEEGYYFDVLRSTATALGRPTQTLSETRTRIAAIEWSREVKQTTWFSLVFLSLILTVSLVARYWPWSRMKVGSGTVTQRQMMTDDFLGIVAWLGIFFLVMVVPVTAYGACRDLVRPHGEIATGNAGLSGGGSALTSIGLSIPGWYRWMKPASMIPGPCTKI